MSKENQNKKYDRQTDVGDATDHSVTQMIFTDGAVPRL